VETHHYRSINAVLTNYEFNVTGMLPVLKNLFLRHKNNLFMKKTLSILVLVCSMTIANAQTDGLGTWNVVNLRKTFNSKWNGFFEAQIRSQQFYNDFSYHEYKGGIGYNFGKQFSVVLAAGQYVTYTPHGNLDTVTNSEFRLWQQFTLTNNINRLKIEHRYRTEQRWASSGYRNRFRYRLNTIIPINKKAVEKNAVYATVSDEIFLTDKKPYFERNRFFAGLGYVFSKLFTLQGGFLRQYDYRATGTSTGKNYLQVSLLFSINEHKSARERHPSTTD
jgi:hypothetical protein